MNTITCLILSIFIAALACGCLYCMLVYEPSRSKLPQGKAKTFTVIVMLVLAMPGILLCLLLGGSIVACVLLFRMLQKTVQKRREQQRVLSREFLQKEGSTSSPPVFAENLLCLFLPRKEREEVVGSMVECFNRDVARYGLKKAKRYFWMETLRELFPLANRFVQAVWRSGILAWLGHIIQKFVS